MRGPAEDRRGLRALLDPPIRTVDRQPERPRGELPLPPRAARTVVHIVGGVLLAAALVIVLMIVNPFVGGEEELIGALLTFLFVSAAVGMAVTGSQRVAAVCGQERVARALAVIGIAAAVGWGLLAAVIWAEPAGADEFIAMLAAASGTATIAWLVGTIGVLQLAAPTISRGLRRFRRIAVGVLAFAGSCAIAGIWIGWLLFAAGLNSRGSEFLLMTLSMVGGWGMLLGLGLCGSATGMGQRMERKRSRTSETIDRDARLRFACPGCGEMAEKKRGPHRCDACGTRVRVRIDEPRCQCGYALFRLAGDRCPECGEAVPDADRYSLVRFDAVDPTRTPASGVDSGEDRRCSCGYILCEPGGERCPECGAAVPDISGAPAADQSSSADAPAETESSTSEGPPSA